MLLVMFQVFHIEADRANLVLLARLDPESFSPFLENRW
jgi:hypothetical protein